MYNQSIVRNIHNTCICCYYVYVSKQKAKKNVFLLYFFNLTFLFSFELWNYILK